MQTDEIRDRNRRFAAAGSHLDVPLMPRLGLFVVTCLDPRTDPAAVLGLEPGDAAVVRNAGGRVTERVLRDLAFIHALAEGAVPVDRPLFEVVLVHHTGCGTGFLADEGFRGRHADRTGLDPDDLAQEAVTDPDRTVSFDVEQVRTSPWLSPRVTVSGWVYDLDSGLLRPVVPAAPVAGRAAA